jgi:hypothetical protein
MDTVERRIASAGAQLDTVAKALDGWRPASEDEKRCIDRFRTYYSSFPDGSKLTTIQLLRVLKEELAKLHQLSKEWIGRKVADYEDEKSRIADIFERVNDARVQFGVRTYIVLGVVFNRFLCLAGDRSPNFQGCACN